MKDYLNHQGEDKEDLTDRELQKIVIKLLGGSDKHKNLIIIFTKEIKAIKQNQIEIIEECNRAK